MSDEPSRRRPGRPPLNAATPSAALHLKLEATDYDRVYRLRQRGESVQDVIRRGIKRFLTDQRSV